jgi:phenylacetate-CoA ligase
VLTHPFKPLDCIEGSQIVQTAPDAVTVRLIPGKDYTEAHTHQLVSELSARLGEEVRLDVQFVDALEVSPNGKFKWVISRVPLGI